tara:strand:+ start:725 stop:1849 length:1125 start_codon:yes stop_codon:yes gene_type:complete
MFGFLNSLIGKKQEALVPTPCPETTSPQRQHVTGHIGHRRRDCWWDPIYSPSLDGSLTEGEWDFDHTAGPCQKFFIGQLLDGIVSRGDTFKVVGVTFKECDFQGVFDSDTLFMFDRCRFIGCDFAYSSWKDTHFRNCDFENCSFALSHFNRCEFRGNTFNSIGISGSKTDFERSFVTNPQALIEAGASRAEGEKPKWRMSLYQWHRLQGSKAHLSRTLLASHNMVGDDHTFYKTAKLHDLQQSKAKIASNFFEFLFSENKGRFAALVSLILNMAENGLLRVVGLLNGWGSSAFRPLLGIALLWYAFGFFYLQFFEVSHPWRKSFNITVLAGYSNEYVDTITSGLNTVQSLHAIVSVIFYTVFFGTVIAKLSRVR